MSRRDGTHEGWPVRVHALGCFEVFVREVRIEARGKTQKKPLELLKVLIALGGTDVHTLVLMDALWPESGKGGVKALEVTIHRLRKLLHSSGSVLVSEQRVSLNRSTLWVDAWAFDDELKRLVPLPGGVYPNSETLKAASTRLLAVYSGNFLPAEVNAPWAYAFRDRLWRVYRSYLTRLGELWEQDGNWAAAIALYEHAIGLDPVAESFYRRLMLCHQKNGARTEAVAVYHRCRQALSIMLGVKPSAETERIYQSLVA